jgi:hypothetical protein
METAPTNCLIKCQVIASLYRRQSSFMILVNFVLIRFSVLPWSLGYRIDPLRFFNLNLTTNENVRMLKKDERKLTKTLYSTSEKVLLMMSEKKSCRCSCI